MKRRKYGEEQTIGILNEAEDGAPSTELCRKHGISGATFSAWKKEERRDERRGSQAVERARGGEPTAEADGRGASARLPDAQSGERKKL